MVCISVLGASWLTPGYAVSHPHYHEPPGPAVARCSPLSAVRVSGQAGALISADRCVSLVDCAAENAHAQRQVPSPAEEEPDALVQQGCAASVKLCLRTLSFAMH